MIQSERKNITQPADWWAEFERQATAEGQSLSAWVGECCAANLPAAAREKITPRRPVGRAAAAKN